MQQLDGKDIDDLESTEIQPINLERSFSKVACQNG